MLVGMRWPPGRASASMCPRRRSRTGPKVSRTPSTPIVSIAIPGAPGRWVRDDLHRQADRSRAVPDGGCDVRPAPPGRGGRAPGTALLMWRARGAGTRNASSLRRLPPPRPNPGASLRRAESDAAARCRPRALPGTEDLTDHDPNACIGWHGFVRHIRRSGNRAGKALPDVWV